MDAPPREGVAANHAICVPLGVCVWCQGRVRCACGVCRGSGGLEGSMTSYIIAIYVHGAWLSSTLEQPGLVVLIKKSG